MPHKHAAWLGAWAPVELWLYMRSKGLIFWIIKVFLRKEINMGFSKSIPLGSKGSLAISESNGKVSLSLNISDSIGGGSVAGAASVGGSAWANVDASLLVSALFELIESKSPAGVQIVEKAVQAEALKLLAAS